MLDEAGLGRARETEASLTQECRALTMHLVGHEPPPYVVDRYGDAHARLTRLRGGSAFDRILVELAVRHPFLARLADAYTAVFARRALVRQKWVLLLALLETTGSTAGHLDRPDHRSPVRLALSALTVAAGSAVSFAFSLVTILPLHAACVAGALIRPRLSR